MKGKVGVVVLLARLPPPRLRILQVKNVELLTLHDANTVELHA